MIPPSAVVNQNGCSARTVSSQAGPTVRSLATESMGHRRPSYSSGEGSLPSVAPISRGASPTGKAADARAQMA
jgi:hypothetical protein